MKPKDPFNGGSRSDDSALFSLRSLAEQVAPPRADAARSRDDSGLIDLAALAAMNEPRDERPKLDVSPFVGVGLFDVPQAAPEPAPPTPAPAPAPARAPRRRTIAVVAGAVMAVAAASAIAIAATRGSGDTQLPPVTALHTAPVAVSPAPEPAKTEPPPPAEVKPIETAAPQTPATPRSPARRGSKPASSAVVKTAPSKPAPACDLMCQMQKSVAKSR